jgi:ribose 1,5-bisphosphate isomerase
LFQGRKTAKELRAAGIKVNMFVDSALGVALSGEQGTKKVSKVFLGADALLKKGVVNKVGSEVIAQVAKNQKIPVYIIADSWKYSPKDLKLEKRDFDEVWEKMPKKSKIKIQNPAFEFVPKKYIKKIVTEFGVMNYCRFLRNVKRV